VLLNATTNRCEHVHFFLIAPGAEFVISPLATVEELETTHSPEYIARFLRGDQTEQEQRNVGFPWSQQGVDRALSSVGGTVAAACSVCEELERRRQHVQSKDLAMTPWAAHVAGGTHHAFYDYGEGFSVFSDMAVASNVVLVRYPHLIKRILMLDLDVHQGNGNAVLFQGRSEVSTVSIHCEGNYFSQKQKSDLDIELPIGCNGATYLMTLNHWLKRIERLSGSDHYDLMFFQAGVDILEDDRLGRMDVSADAVKKRNEMVFDFARRLNLPLVICMGGGYPRNPEDWTPIIDAHSQVYFGAHQYLARVSRDD
jgi:acetoin utilization deacetylase AcuC-like enzyme